MPATPEAKSLSKRKIPRWRWIACALVFLYLVALIASYAQRRELAQTPQPIPPALHTQQVSAVVGDHILSQPVQIAYRDISASSPNAAIPVVLIHGSPGNSEVLELIMDQLKGPRRLIAPDLPGFGYSSTEIPDYSFRAHATYVWELLDKLGVQRVHLVGFSMGGGVVLNMARTAPDRVASITMLSALSVQEMEMLGDYHLNHIVHGAQLAALWLLKTAVPRFGSWNHTDMGIPYARNFYDSDQRPLRAILQNYNGPMLILHGAKDPLVPVEAAKEVNRLVPQSELTILSSNHFMIFQDPRPLEAPLVNFLNRVEAGQAQTRLTTDPARIARAGLPMDTKHWPRPGFVTVAVTVIFLSLMTLLNEDLACIVASTLVAEGRAVFSTVLIACMAGIFVADLFLFLSGRWGRELAQRVPLRWAFHSHSFSSISSQLARGGMTSFFISRFSPGGRVPACFSAGALRVAILKFLAALTLAAAAWPALLVSLSTVLTLPFLHHGFLGKQTLSIKLLVVALVLFPLLRIAKRLATSRANRHPSSQ